MSDTKSKHSTTSKKETSNQNDKSTKQTFDNPEVLTKVDVIINTSPSKQMYSFPKAERFKSQKQSQVPFCYEMKSLLDKRGTTLGYGNRMDLAAKKLGRSDNIYDIPREFDVNKSHGTPKYTFGLSRDMCYYAGQQKNDRYSPGPGSYEFKPKFAKEAFKFSMFSRRNMEHGKVNYPGPGSYAHIELNKEGKYPISSLENRSGNMFSKEMRFKHSFGKKNQPGPGSYDHEVLINGKGTSFNSNYKNYLGKSMAWRNMLVGNKLNTPGPGAYDFFSDFEGFNKYGHKNAESRKAATEGKKNESKEQNVEEKENTYEDKQ